MNFVAVTIVFVIVLGQWTPGALTQGGGVRHLLVLFLELFVRSRSRFSNFSCALRHVPFLSFHPFSFTIFSFVRPL